jgi:hypothetical protein
MLMGTAFCGWVALQKEKRDELKRRGDPNTHTSDAKFDERFAMAYGLVGDKVGSAFLGATEVSGGTDRDQLSARRAREAAVASAYGTSAYDGLVRLVQLRGGGGRVWDGEPGSDGGEESPAMDGFAPPPSCQAQWTGPPPFTHLPQPLASSWAARPAQLNIYNN